MISTMGVFLGLQLAMIRPGALAEAPWTCASLILPEHPQASPTRGGGRRLTTNPQTAQNPDEGGAHTAPIRHKSQRDTRAAAGNFHR
jgi:hypothetical protein